MSAKEMFEELGYEQFKKGETITYSNIDLDFDIKFADDGFVEMYDFTIPKPIDDDVTVLTIEELKAINQQCKELGWID